MEEVNRRFGFDTLKAIEDELAKIHPISPYVFEVLEAAQRDDISLLDLGRRLSFDPVICAHLLRACRSAAYGIRFPVESPLHAVALLGAERVIQIVLSLTIKEQIGFFLASSFEHEVWEHSLAVAFGIQGMIRLLNSPLSLAVGFTAGLLHDLGKLVLYRASGGDPDLAQAQLKGGEVGLKAERERCGKDHIQIMASILEQWALSNEIKQAILEHHLSPREMKTSLGRFLLWSHYLARKARHEREDGEPPPLKNKDLQQLVGWIRLELEALSCFFS